jgi:hypothetical protein
MALGTTQTLVKMSTRDIPGGKGGRCVRLTSPFRVPNVMKSGSLKLLELSGPHRACYGSPLPLQYKVRVWSQLWSSAKTVESIP